MKSVSRRSVVALGATALLAGIGGRAKAAGKYGPGVSDAEIKLGTTAYYSGRASTAAAYGLAQVAYFQMVNDRGGINGRRVNLISLDNAFSPPKALEQTRKFVESDEVFAIAGSLGTPTNVAIQKYLNVLEARNFCCTFSMRVSWTRRLAAHSVQSIYQISPMTRVEPWSAW
jgi:ABC-type branched-subunit amino acid transport system substrate-binding protein